jgi:ankyrin repeat protein
VAALLAAGVNLDLHQAAVVGNLDTVKAELTDYPEDLDIYSRDGFTPLLMACYFGHAEMAQYLLDIGADVQAVSHNPMGIQAIHAAAANSNMTILQALLEKGANANAKQASGNTALDQAIQSKNQAMIALLRQHGATV